MRLGIFGGSFDPPHLGHLLVASDALEALRLDRLVLIPTAQQPLKVGHSAAPAEARLEMVRRSIAEFPKLECDSVEVDRSGLSYTVDTLAEYANRFPNAELFLLMGMDAAGSLPSWREPNRVAKLARLVLLRRALSATDDGRAKHEETVKQVTELAEADSPPIVVATRRIDISSTEIRARVRNGAPIHGFVTESVAQYIAASGLYR